MNKYESFIEELYCLKRKEQDEDDQENILHLEEQQSQRTGYWLRNARELHEQLNRLWNRHRKYIDGEEDDDEMHNWMWTRVYNELHYITSSIEENKLKKKKRQWKISDALKQHLRIV